MQLNARQCLMKTNVHSRKFITHFSYVNHTHVSKISNNAVKANIVFPIKLFQFFIFGSQLLDITTNPELCGLFGIS